ncbi:MAG: hypothetical protein IJ521_03450, partial [Schwartzia sp.]|nr:hypothetical protein [Schwartzia sp. (in: firmicutes)]
MSFLKLGNKVVLEFDLKKGDFLIYESDLLPIPLRDRLIDSRKRKDFSSFAVNYDALMTYFHDRRLSVKRENAKAILNSLNIAQGDGNDTVLKTMILCKALSVVDDYWISNDSSETWENVNLRDNPLHETLSQIALSGFSPLSITGEIRTPELTALGLYAKTWRRENGILYLYKSSTLHGIESEIEVEVSNILDFTNVPHVHYDFLHENGLRLCKCKSMCSKSRSIVPAIDVATWCSRTGRDFDAFTRKLDSENYYKTLVVDYLVSNSDRHMGNWGFYMDNYTGELTGLHPLFDHNGAFDAKRMLYPDGGDSYMMMKYNMRFCAELGMKHCNFEIDPYIPENVFLNREHLKAFQDKAKRLHLKIHEPKSLFLIPDKSAVDYELLESDFLLKFKEIEGCVILQKEDIANAVDKEHGITKYLALGNWKRNEAMPDGEYATWIITNDTVDKSLALTE